MSCIRRWNLSLFPCREPVWRGFSHENRGAASGIHLTDRPWAALALHMWYTASGSQPPSLLTVYCPTGRIYVALLNVPVSHLALQLSSGSLSSYRRSKLYDAQLPPHIYRGVTSAWSFSGRCIVIRISMLSTPFWSPKIDGPAFLAGMKPTSPAEDSRCAPPPDQQRDTARPSVPCEAEGRSFHSETP